MATGTSLSSVFPLGSRLNERGRLEIGGCDTIELAREFGTPASVVAEDELRMALRHRVALIVLDNFDEIERLGRLVAEGELADRAGGQSVLVRVTPDVRGETHEKVSTGQADSKFGFAMADAPEAIARVGATIGLAMQRVH